MKINSKQMLIDKIEARRKRRGLSGQRTPNWDYMISLAESLDIHSPSVAPLL
jgi:hypothetical protein